MIGTPAAWTAAVAMIPPEKIPPERVQQAAGLKML
jgi:hypothetical protein